jgi:hypothetical protein
MTACSEAIQSASTFLSASVATETGLSVVQLLHNAIPPSAKAAKPGSTRTSEVVTYSLLLLRATHAAVLAEKRQLGVKGWRQVNALIEVIVILGLYRSLTPGVGVPESRRIKSILLIKERQPEMLSEDERVLLLESIISEFTEIVEQGGEIGQNLQRRHLIAILSGLTELSFNPSIPIHQRNIWKVKYENFVSKYLPLTYCANFLSFSELGSSLFYCYDTSSYSHLGSRTTYAETFFNTTAGGRTRRTTNCPVSSPQIQRSYNHTTRSYRQSRRKYSILEHTGSKHFVACEILIIDLHSTSCYAGHRSIGR